MPIRTTARMAAIAIACATVGTLTPSPAQALTFGTQDVICPLTGVRFAARVMASGSTIGMHLDMRPVGSITAAAPVPICPDETKFPVFRSDFKPADVESLKRFVRTEAYRRVVAEGHSPHYVAAIVKRFLGEDTMGVATALLVATWDDEVTEELRQRYRREARDAFVAAAAASGASDRQVAMGRFLQVEMTRQLGEFDEARAMLDRWEAAGTKWEALGLSEAIRGQARNAIDRRNAGPVRVAR